MRIAQTRMKKRNKDDEDLPIMRFTPQQLGWVKCSELLARQRKEEAQRAKKKRGKKA